MKIRYWLFPSLMLLPMVALASDTIELASFLQMVWDAGKNFGGLSWAAKVAAVCTLLVALMKVSVLQSFWNKLGWAKVLVSSVLGGVGGVVMLSMSGQLTAAGVIAYLISGAGAVVLHQIMDAVKEIPGLGAQYIAMIDFFKSLLGGK